MGRIKDEAHARVGPLPFDVVDVATAILDLAQKHLSVLVDDDDPRWQAAYIWVFGTVSPALKGLGITPDFHDPDGSYCDDVLAFLRAARDAVHFAQT